jgi:hypothetical protein
MHKQKAVAETTASSSREAEKGSSNYCYVHVQIEKQQRWRQIRSLPCIASPGESGWLRAKLHGATRMDLISYFGIQGADAKNSTPLLSLTTWEQITDPKENKSQIKNIVHRWPHGRAESLPSPAPGPSRPPRAAPIEPLREQQDGAMLASWGFLPGRWALRPLRHDRKRQDRWVAAGAGVLSRWWAPAGWAASPEAAAAQP